MVKTVIKFSELLNGYVLKSILLNLLPLYHHNNYA